MPTRATTRSTEATVSLKLDVGATPAARSGTSIKPRLPRQQRNCSSASGGSMPLRSKYVASRQTSDAAHGNHNQSPARRAETADGSHSASTLSQDKLAVAIAYALKRWVALTRYIDDGRLEIDNLITERAIRGVAIGRRNWLFAGSNVGASYCSSSHPLITQIDFFGDRQTPGVATAARQLRGGWSPAPTPCEGLSRARPCMVGWRQACDPRSSASRSTC
jgi:Transposase IS66 family